MEEKKGGVKKGLFRLWLSLSVVWWLLSLIVIIVLFFTDSYRTEAEGDVIYEHVEEEAIEGEGIPTVHPDRTIVGKRGYFQWPWFLLSIIPAVLPPFAIYLFSKFCYWIYKGFKEDKES